MKLVHVREASEGDLPGVLALYSHPDIDGNNLLSVDEAKAVFRRFRSYPNYKLFVACDEERIVGTFTLLIIDNLAHRGSPSGLVEDVVVSADRQYQGIGKQMMKVRTGSVPRRWMLQDGAVEQSEARRCSPVLRVARVREARVQLSGSIG